MNEKFNKDWKIEQLTKVVLSHGEEKGHIVKDPWHWTNIRNVLHTKSKVKKADAQIMENNKNSMVNFRLQFFTVDFPRFVKKKTRMS